MISVLSLYGSILPTTDPVFHLVIQEDVCLCVCVWIKIHGVIRGVDGSTVQNM